MLTNIHTLSKYDCSVNCIQWAPAEYGVKLIAGLSSGKIIVASYLPADETWDQHIIDAHDSSVNSISIAKADNHYFIKFTMIDTEKMANTKDFTGILNDMKYEQFILFSKTVKLSTGFRQGNGLKHKDGVLTLVGDYNQKTSFTSQIKTFDMDQILQGNSGIVYE